MNFEEFSGISFIMLFVLYSEANGLCTRNQTIKDQHTAIVDEACEWTINTSDAHAKLLIIVTRQENDANLCCTDDSIEVKKSLTDGTDATLLIINCTTPYIVQLVFSSTSKVKVTARGAAIAANMTWIAYSTQHFTKPQTDEGYWNDTCHKYLTSMLKNGVRELSMTQMLESKKKELLTVNDTFFERNKGTVAEKIQNCDNQCSTSDFFAFHDKKCYCVDGRRDVLNIAKFCTYPCPGSLGKICGGPNSLTIYTSDSTITCQLLNLSNDYYYTRTYANCSTEQRYIYHKERCGQTFAENKGAFNLTVKPGKHHCNWTISVGSHVTVNVSADMVTKSSLQSHFKQKLSVFTQTTSTNDLGPETLNKTGHIQFIGVCPVFIILTTDSTTSTTVIVRWQTSTICNAMGNTTHILGENVVIAHEPSTIHINTEHSRNKDGESDKKIALYIPVTVSVCVIVVVAIVVAICLRRKRGKKNAQRNVNDYNYSYTTTDAQTIHSFPAEQSHPECKLGEYTEVFKPQLPGSASNVSATGPDANNQDYNTLHQQLEPTYSDPQENVYNETVPLSTDDGQYDVSSVSPLINKSAYKSHGLTDNVYNTAQSPNDTFGNYDVQYDVSSASTFSKECIKKSKGQTDNVYNTFKSPDDTEYSEANLHIKE